MFLIKKACSHKGQVSQPLIQTHIHIDTNTEERDPDKPTHTQSNNLSQTERNEEKKSHEDVINRIPL